MTTFELHKNGLRRLAREIAAEHLRPTWRTGDEITEGKHAGEATAVFNPAGKARAFAVDEQTATAIAEAMTVVARLETEGATEVVTQADLAEARYQRDAALAERDRLVGLLDNLRAERDRLRSDLARATDAREVAEGVVAVLRRRLADLEKVNQRLDSERVNVLRNAELAALTARSQVADVLRRALAQMEAKQ